MYRLVSQLLPGRRLLHHRESDEASLVSFTNFLITQSLRAMKLVLSAHVGSLPCISPLNPPHVLSTGLQCLPLPPVGYYVGSGILRRRPLFFADRHVAVSDAIWIFSLQWPRFVYFGDLLLCYCKMTLVKVEATAASERFSPLLLSVTLPRDRDANGSANPAS